MTRLQEVESMIYIGFENDIDIELDRQCASEGQNELQTGILKTFKYF